MSGLLTQPLRGMRVVEVSHYVAGPVAGMILADLGSDVIKIESPTVPDPTRSYVNVQGLSMVTKDGKRLMWESFNRNKRSLTLDLKSEQGRAVLAELVRSADIFVTNLQPRSLKERGADFESLRKINPRIVFALGTGLGTVGRRANDRTLDTIGMAYAGFMWTVAETSKHPHYPLGAMSDVQAGTNLAFAALAGVIARERTGEAQLTGTSQLQTLMWMQSLNLAAMANLGQNFTPETISPFFAVYPCRDDRWIALAVGRAETDLPVLADLIGVSDLLAAARKNWPSGPGGVPEDPDSQTEFLNAVSSMITKGLRAKTRDQWLELLRPTQISVGPVNTVSDLLADEHVAEERLLVDLDNGMTLAASPIMTDGLPRRGAPELGAQTFEILSELGYTDVQITALYADHVAG